MITIIDHGAKGKRRELRRVIGGHFVNEQIAKAQKSKGAELTSGERRNISERSLGTLEKRGFFRDH